MKSPPRTGADEAEPALAGQVAPEIAAAFESHVVTVMTSLAECFESCDALLELGVAAEDVGLVIGAGALKAWRTLSRDKADGETPSAAGRFVHFAVLPPHDDGADLVASHGYPSELLRAAAEECGTKRRASAFYELMPAHDGVALSRALVDGAAAIWVRVCEPELASRVAEQMLRRSSQRVRTFTRAATSKK